MTDHPSQSDRSCATKITLGGWSSAAGFAWLDTLHLGAGERRHFSTEIAGRPFDALAKRKADEAADLDRRTHRALALLERLGDALFVVVDKRLIDEADFLVEGLEPRFDDLLDYIHRFALRLGLVG